VSWIYPPGDTSGHPPDIPARGAQMIASKLEALSAARRYRARGRSCAPLGGRGGHQRIMP
jgi:hypothetical protein